MALVIAIKIPPFHLEPLLRFHTHFFANDSRIPPYHGFQGETNQTERGQEGLDGLTIKAVSYFFNGEIVKTPFSTVSPFFLALPRWGIRGDIFVIILE